MLERTTKAPGLAGRIVLRAIDDGAAAPTALRRAEVHVLAEVAPIHVPKEPAKPADGGALRRVSGQPRPASIFSS